MVEPMCMFGESIIDGADLRSHGSGEPSVKLTVVDARRHDVRDDCVGRGDEDCAAERFGGFAAEV
jgi:hypothetical protein